MAVAASELRHALVNTFTVVSPCVIERREGAQAVQRMHSTEKLMGNAPWARANRSLLGAMRRRREDSRAAPHGVPVLIEVHFPASMCRRRRADRSVAARGSPVKPRALSVHWLASCLLHRQRLRSPRAGGGSTTKKAAATTRPHRPTSPLTATPGPCGPGGRARARVRLPAVRRV